MTKPICTIETAAVMEWTCASLKKDKETASVWSVRAHAYSSLCVGERKRDRWEGEEMERGRYEKAETLRLMKAFQLKGDQLPALVRMCACGNICNVQQTRQVQYNRTSLLPLQKLYGYGSFSSCCHGYMKCSNVGALSELCRRHTQYTGLSGEMMSILSHKWGRFEYFKQQTVKEQCKK